VAVEQITAAMASSFLYLFLKLSVMPNQGNKSNGKSGVVKPKKDATMPSKEKQGANGKNSSAGKKGDTGSSGKGGK
jgi:hypothetical protein